MNLDLLSTRNCCLTINEKLIQMLGLDTAAHLTVILDALHQAKKKNRINEDGYFKLDRKYATERTGLTTAEQKHCEDRLILVNLLKRDAETLNLLSVDVGAVVQFIQQDDAKFIDKVKLTLAKQKKDENDEYRKEQMARAIKTAVKTTDFELRQAIFDWIDAMDGTLRKAAVPLVEDAINAYTKDKQVKIKLFQIMAINSLRDPQWAINRYERDYKPKGLGEQKVATSLFDVDMTNKF